VGGPASQIGVSPASRPGRLRAGGRDRRQSESNGSGSRRGRRGLVGRGRDALGDDLVGDDRLAGTAAAGATTLGDHLAAAATGAAAHRDHLTAARAAIARDGPAGTAITRNRAAITGTTVAHDSRTVAATAVLAEQAMAPLPTAVAAAGTTVAVATPVLAEQSTTVAAGGTVAAVAGDGTRVTADEGDCREGKQHGERKAEKTLHH